MPVGNENRHVDVVNVDGMTRDESTTLAPHMRAKSQILATTAWSSTQGGADLWTNNQHQAFSTSSSGQFDSPSRQGIPVVCGRAVDLGTSGAENWGPAFSDLAGFPQLSSAGHVPQMQEPVVDGYGAGTYESTARMGFQPANVSAAFYETAQPLTDAPLDNMYATFGHSNGYYYTNTGQALAAPANTTSYVNDPNLFTPSPSTFEAPVASQEAASLEASGVSLDYPAMIPAPQDLQFDLCYDDGYNQQVIHFDLSTDQGIYYALMHLPEDRQLQVMAEVCNM